MKHLKSFESVPFYTTYHIIRNERYKYNAEQMESTKVSTQRYRVIFKPSVIVPNIDVE